MTKTDKHQKGVMAITLLAQIIDPKIGSYVEHYERENLGFQVKVSNGSIDMPVEIAQDYDVQANSTIRERILAVATTFKKG